MNWAGLLLGNVPVHDETTAIRTYNVASVVSSSTGGATARFRTWARIIRARDNAVVYSRYKDVTMPAGTYTCVAYSTGWTPTEPGSYTVKTYVQALSQFNSVLVNDTVQKQYVVSSGAQLVRNDDNQSIQGNQNNIPEHYGLFTNNPNPFSRMTNIQW